MMMDRIYKYGFLVAVAMLILLVVFRGRDKSQIQSLENKIKARDGQIDSLALSNRHHAELVFKLKEDALVRADSIDSLARENNYLQTSYEKKVAANRYRTVAEFEGFLAERYPERGDSAQVAHGADR